MEKDRSDEVESSDGKPKRADRLSTRDAIKHSKASYLYIDSVHMLYLL